MNKKNDSKRLNRFHYAVDTVIEKPFNWKQMLRLFGFMKPYSKKLLPLAIIAMIISTAVRLITPILIGVVALNNVIYERDAQALTKVVILMAALYLLS